MNNALGISLPHEEFETIGGYIVGLFGRLPRESEEIEATDGVCLRVDRTRGRRILAVRVLNDRRRQAASAAEEEAATVRE